MRKLVALLYCLRDVLALPAHRCKLRNWHQLEAHQDGYAYWTCMECGRTNRCKATWVAARLAVFPSLSARATVEAKRRREEAVAKLRDAVRGRGRAA